MPSESFQLSEGISLLAASRTQQSDSKQAARIVLQAAPNNPTADRLQAASRTQQSDSKQAARIVLQAAPNNLAADRLHAASHKTTTWPQTGCTLQAAHNDPVAGKPHATIRQQASRTHHPASHKTTTQPQTGCKLQAAHNKPAADRLQAASRTHHPASRTQRPGRWQAANCRPANRGIRLADQQSAACSRRPATGQIFYKGNPLSY